MDQRSGFTDLAAAVRRAQRDPSDVPTHSPDRDEARIRAGIEIAKRSADAFRKAISSGSK